MEIEECRNEIDAIDSEILRLLGERAEMARRIGGLKTAAGLPVADPTREKAILRALAANNRTALTDSAVIRIFRGIIRESRRLQSKRRPARKLES